MEPKKDSESPKPVYYQFGNEQPLETVPMTPASKEAEPVLQREAQTIKEQQAPTSELQEMERRPGIITTAVAPPTTTTATDDLQTIGKTLDPSDRMAVEEIKAGEKLSSTEARSWLSRWWDRQVKIIKHRMQK